MIAVLAYVILLACGIYIGMQQYKQPQWIISNQFYFRKGVIERAVLASYLDNSYAVFMITLVNYLDILGNDKSPKKLMTDMLYLQEDGKIVGWIRLLPKKGEK